MNNPACAFFALAEFAQVYEREIFHDKQNKETTPTNPKASRRTY